MTVRFGMRALGMFLVLLLVQASLSPLAAGQENAVAPPIESEAVFIDPAEVEEGGNTAEELVSVDWVREMIRGGLTMVALGALSVALLAFAAERIVMMRVDRFAPPQLLKKLQPLSIRSDAEAIIEQCRKHPSTLGRVMTYIARHRFAEPQLLAGAASDLGAREMADQEQRTIPFAVIAALAPLLGLLGTMIGMIEAFKLVEVYGDEGGASMLAGSISKALITTAVGLILSIPAIGLYHWFKHRQHVVTQQLESQIDELFSRWYLERPERQAADPAAARRAKTVPDAPAKSSSVSRPAPVRVGPSAEPQS